MTRGYSISPGRLVRCLIFMGFSFFVTWLINEGKLDAIVHPRMRPWLVAAGLLSLALSASELLRLGDKPRSPDSLSFYCPMIAVVAIVYLHTQAGPLSPADLALRPEVAAFEASVKKRDAAFEEASERPLGRRIVVDDDGYWALYNRLYDDPESAEGASIIVQGFLVRDAGLPLDTALVARNLMWCCAADMAVIGFAAEGPQARDLPEGAWVEVAGTLARSDLDLDGDGAVSPVPLIEIRSIRQVERGQSTTVFPY